MMPILQKTYILQNNGLVDQEILQAIIAGILGIWSLVDQIIGQKRYCNGILPPIAIIRHIRTEEAAPDV